MKTITTEYLFKLEDGRELVFNLMVGGPDFKLQGLIPAELPGWTELDFNQCPHCPLKVDEHPHCPLAANIVKIIDRFEGLMSDDTVRAIITTENRLTTIKTTAQKSISSLMGLVIATCGCPHTAFLKPMARFHLPLADEEETIYRATSMYMLAQFFLKRDGLPFDFDLQELSELYNNLTKVNLTLAARLREAFENDPSVHAIIFLNMYAQVMPFAVGESLEELRYLFKPYFDAVKK